MLDYETLRVIWWVLLGTLLIGFAVMDGFDLGVGMLLPIVARNNDERRVIINTVGPVWEGNQIWLVLGAGAIFAAWPTLYAISFSGFYFAMLLVLFGLILRPVGFKYRGKVDNTTWRSVWDLGLFLGGFIPALIFGVALGNVLQGVPFYFDDMLRGFYTGNLLGLLNPFALLCGLLSVVMLAMHGAVFLSIKTEGVIAARARRCVYVGAVLTIVFFALAGFFIMHSIEGYTLSSVLAHDVPSNPMHKVVTKAVGAWMSNYSQRPLLWIVPACGFLGSLLTLFFVKIKWVHLAWIASALTIAGIITTVGISMFPFILPSSLDPNMSLMVWDTSSSQLTLFIMLIATIIFLPLILLYTSWVYYVLRGKVTDQAIKEHTKSAY